MEIGIEQLDTCWLDQSRGAWCMAALKLNRFTQINDHVMPHDEYRHRKDAEFALLDVIKHGVIWRRILFLEIRGKFTRKW